MVRFYSTRIAAVLACLWLAGCASAPKAPAPTEGAPESSDVLPPPDADTQAAPAGVPETPASKVGPDVRFLPPPKSSLPPPLPAPAAPAPAPGPKPWKVVLEHGSRRAVIDGVTVWLSEPAKLGKDKRVAATPVDRRATLDPLLNAGTNALVRGRPVRVMIDPGHGGQDPGALSRDHRQRESAHVMDIARRLSTYLTRAGYEVRMTRNDDATFVPLEDRPAMAAAWPADVFVSIHLNSSTGSTAEGLETYLLPAAGMRATYQVDQAVLPAAAQAQVDRWNPGNQHDARNMQLAFCVQRRLARTTGYSDRGIRRARFAVLRDARMPAILVEAGFLSNRKDADFLATPAGRERIARGIYQGLCDFAAGHIAPGFPAPPVNPATPAPAPTLVIP